MKHHWLQNLAVLLPFLICLGISPGAWAEQRLAFVVGIDRYPKLSDDSQLQRAVADADSVGDSLRRLGFNVTLLDRGQAVSQLYFLRQLRSFAGTVQPGDTVIFYFAGHGIGVEGNNFLIPADIPSLDEIDGDGLQVRAISEATIRRVIDERRPGVALLLLDACRNNPFKTPDRSIGATRGLQPIEAPRGMMTIYAASAGQTALDRLPANDPDPNSVFTRVVVRELAQPGVNIVEFSEDVRDQVEALARGANHDQVPAVESNLIKGRSIFLGRAPVTAASSDQIAWSLVEGTSDAETLRRFLDQFPESPRSTEARARLASLAPPASPTPHIPTSTPAPDDDAWASLPAAATPVEIRTFMIRFPQSHLILQAEKRLALARDDALWAGAKDGDAAAQREYLLVYPEGAHRREAEQRLATLEVAGPPSLTASRPPPVDDGDAQWRVISASTEPEIIRRFIVDHPRSSLRSRAQARLHSLDDALWLRTRRGGAGAQRRYLAAYPDGAHRAEAQARTAALEAPAMIPAVPRSVPEAAVRRPAVRHVGEHSISHERRTAVDRGPAIRVQEPHHPAKAIAADRPSSRCFSAGDQTFCQ